MARLLIPTRNRPTALKGTLDYLAHFHPSTEVIIADGGDEYHQVENEKNIQIIRSKLAVDYRKFPAEMNFFDRLLAVVNDNSDEFVIMGSDDDFPMMDVLGEAESFLSNNSDYSTAMGATVRLHLDRPDEMSAHLRLVRDINGPTALRRANQYFAWPFSTTYAVTRREVLVERFRRAKAQYLAKFYDYMAALYDCMCGKIKAIPDIGFISTANYNHSYLRPEANLVYLRRSEQVLALADQIRQDLENYDGLDNAAALGASQHLITAPIRVLVGSVPETRAGFLQSKEYKDPVAQKQLELFRLLFEEGNPVRQKYLEKMEFIAAAITSSALSDDNKDEPKKYETVDAQSAHRTSPSGRA